ncbi:MAG TPA: polysaccharide biosynthesis tyrosine autokinase [Gemmatimonadaceae bacterium]|nr:polysaccharide biosynthesis tyrosine autokinase [Gemmatimonadaceae bacterium]
MSNENLPAPLTNEYGYLAEPGAQAAWAPQVPEPEEGGGLNLERYFSALKRYKWLIAGLFVVGLGAGFVATRFMVPQYQATATVWLGAGRASGMAGPVEGTDPLQDAQNWMLLLTSQNVLNTIVERRQLYLTLENPADSMTFRTFRVGEGFRRGSFVLRVAADGRQYSLLEQTDVKDSASTMVLEAGAVGDSIGRKAGFLWQPDSTTIEAGRSYAFRVISPASAASNLKGRITARPDPRSSVANISLVGNDRYEVAATLNAIVEEFVATADEVNTRNQYEVIDRLTRQVDSASSLLVGAEKALEEYRVRTITQPNEGTGVPLGMGQGPAIAVGNPSMAKYFGFKQQLEGYRQERRSLERVLAEVQRGQVSQMAFQGIPSAQASAIPAALADLTARQARVTQLRLTYTDEHPAVQQELQMIRLLTQEQIPRLTESLITELTKREAAVSSQLGEAGRELQAIPARTTAEQQLQRNVGARAGVHSQLLQALEQSRIRALSERRPISVLDTARVPARPQADQSLMILLAAALGGLGLGLASAIVLDRVDHRFRYPEQATKELGLSIVGGVPRIAKDAAADPEEQAQVVEAFRTIRMNLRYALDGIGGPLSLAVSSPGPGDGKSLVSANIAVSFAEAGYRTLLVDGDIRRGQLHESFREPIPRRPGLIDYLTGMVPLESVLRETGVDNLTLVPCGTRRHRGPELLQSPMLPAFLDEMRTRYDVVIVDSPPLAAGIDPFVLGSATGNMVLVFRAGETDRRLAHARIGLLKRLPINVVGAVLNDIKAEGSYKYYSYLYGYSLDEDEGGTPALAGSVE